MASNQLSEKPVIARNKNETSLETKENQFVTYLRSIGGVDVHQFDDTDAATVYGQKLRLTVENSKLIDVEITYRTVRVRLKEVAN